MVRGVSHMLVAHALQATEQNALMPGNAGKGNSKETHGHNEVVATDLPIAPCDAIMEHNKLSVGFCLLERRLNRSHSQGLE